MSERLSLNEIREKQLNGEIDSIVSVALQTIIKKDNNCFHEIITEKIINNPTLKIIEVPYEGKSLLVIVNLWE